MEKESKRRVIFHIDMNCFYAAVEVVYDPSLKGKPLAIAGNPKERRGVIVTSSYEARDKGVHTRMAIWEAKKICPDLIVRKPNFERYRKMSKQMFQLLFEYTPLVEPVSIDEGYMDVTEAAMKEHPVDIAKNIQSRLYEQLGLPSSIGIAPNKFLAKTASNMKKPMGITVLRKREVKEKLWHLQTVKMHGVGPKTAQKLKTLGIHTIGDLANYDDTKLKLALGINGPRLKKRANGIDERAVDPNSVYDFKSIGNSTTLPYDVTDVNEIHKIFKQLAHKVFVRMKNKHVSSSNIQIVIRFENRMTITRSKKLKNPIYLEDEIFHEAITLFKENWDLRPIRLIGITANELVDREETVKQLDLFSYNHDAKEEPLLDIVEKLRDKYGKEIIRKGIPRKNKDFDIFDAKD